MFFLGSQNSSSFSIILSIFLSSPSASHGRVLKTSTASLPVTVSSVATLVALPLVFMPVAISWFVNFCLNFFKFSETFPQIEWFRKGRPKWSAISCVVARSSWSVSPAFPWVVFPLFNWGQVYLRSGSFFFRCVCFLYLAEISCTSYSFLGHVLFQIADANSWILRSVFVPQLHSTVAEFTSRASLLTPCNNLY